MSGETRVFGSWQSGDVEAPLSIAVIGSPDGQQFALMIDTGDGWETAAGLYYEESAQAAAKRIDRLATQSDYARMGTVESNWGQGTSHPGVEWITATSDDRSIEFPERLDSGMARLWIVPSADGQVFGLLAPDDEQHELGLFVSEAAALKTVQVIDALAQPQ